MDYFLTLLISAILVGATYTLVALGYCLFFGVLDVVVFCCGDIAIFGAFSIVGGYTILYDLGLYQSLPAVVSVVLVLLIATILCVALGLFAYLFSIKPFEKSSELMPLLSTIALGVVIREALGLLYKPIVNGLAGALTRVDTAIMVTNGRNPQAMPALLSPGGSTNMRNFLIVLIMVVIILALFWFLNKTRMGLSMQAMSQNKQLAIMTGVDTKKAITTTFAIGGILMALGGFLLGSYQTIVRFDGGSLYGTKGFSAAVVGGLKSIWGAIIGGMLLGFAEVFFSGYIPGGSQYQNVIAFLVVIIFIIFKPEGILGEKTVEKV